MGEVLEQKCIRGYVPLFRYNVVIKDTELPLGLCLLTGDSEAQKAKNAGVMSQCPYLNHQLVQFQDSKSQYDQKYFCRCVYKEKKATVIYDKKRKMEDEK